RETVDAGRYGREGGENVARGRQLPRFVEGHVVLFDGRADALQRTEGRVAFVHVVDVGMDAHRFQGADTADAQDDLLLDARLHVAAVELAGDRAIDGVVLGQIGVEQIQVDS